MSTEDGLPRFSIKPFTENDPWKKIVYLTQNYRDAEPKYIKERSKHPDEYAVSLLDAHYSDILYAQVIAKPGISTPSLSADEIKRQRNGGSPVLPNITLPSEFTIQLYNPESQVVVKHTKNKFSGDYWEFSVPQKSFRQPTSSKLDQTLYKSSALPPSGILKFRWKKGGGVVGKPTLQCNLLSTANEASHDPKARKKGGAEPDIPLASMEKLRDITIYEPNLKRVDLEDRKGLELILVLSAAVIGDIHYTPPAAAFNVSPQSSITPSSLPISNPSAPVKLTKIPSPPIAAATVVNSTVYAENARLVKQQQEAERRRQREEEAEERHIRKLLEEEERQEKQRQATVDAETQRLRRKYAEDTRAWEAAQQKTHTTQQKQQYNQLQYWQQHHQNRRSTIPQGRPPIQPQRPMVVGSDNYLSPHAYTQVPPPQQQVHSLGRRKKSSALLNLFGGGSDSSKEGRLSKKKSSLF